MKRIGIFNETGTELKKFVIEMNENEWYELWTKIFIMNKKNKNDVITKFLKDTEYMTRKWGRRVVK